MNLTRLWTITRLELTQRVRSVAWYVLLGIFALILVDHVLAGIMG